jgi:ABC-type phosphate transport system substrate-binding protein
MIGRLMLGLGFVLLLAPGRALAQQACEDDVNVGKNRVYILAADTQVPVLKALGIQLRKQNPEITIIYSPNGSCTNIQNLYTNTYLSNASGGGTFYIPKDPNFTATSTAPNCTPPVPSPKPDLAISIIFPDAVDCPMAGSRPANIVSTQGPVQAMVFAVPGGIGSSMGSTQTTITAEEAYLVLGLGPTKAMVSPWSDPLFIYGRPASKGTQISIGANIGVAAAKWKLLTDTMHMIDQSKDMATAIAANLSNGNAEKTLGILGVEIYDSTTNRAALHSLAFRAFGQTHSYWPDSTPTAFDKKNVRDGHYPLWSYVQYMVPSTDGKTAVNPNAQMIIDLLTGAPVTLSAPFEPLGVVIGAGLVPQCAMKVGRTVEGGAVSAVSPAAPCGCYYDSVVPMSTTSCTACTTSCASGMCRHGYCEAQ